MRNALRLLLATLVQVGVSILQQAPAALGPVLTADLELSRAQIGLLSSAIWGGMLLTMLPVGLLIDRHGERRLIMAGVTAMALLVLWATQFSTFAWLLILPFTTHYVALFGEIDTVRDRTPIDAMAQDVLARPG